MIWQIDPTHSHLSFAVRVLSVSTTRGRFHALRGHLHIDEQHPANSWVEASVDAASIDTRAAQVLERDPTAFTKWRTGRRLSPTVADGANSGRLRALCCRLSR